MKIIEWEDGTFSVRRRWFFIGEYLWRGNIVSNAEWRWADKSMLETTFFRFPSLASAEDALRQMLDREDRNRKRFEPRTIYKVKIQ